MPGETALLPPIKEPQLQPHSADHSRHIIRRMVKQSSRQSNGLFRTTPEASLAGKGRIDDISAMNEWSSVRKTGDMLKCQDASVSASCPWASEIES